MKHTRVALITAIFLLTLGGIWWWVRSKQKPSVVPSAAVPMQVVQNASEPNTGVTAPNGVSSPPLTTNKEELHQWWLAMAKLDKKFEWKMPIAFYGKVLDDRDQPVEGAMVHFEWTNFSASGSAEQTTRSDTKGLFQLTGVTGKNLGVRVTKAGYLVYDKNRSSFEYAAYFESNFHVPDQMKPVVFRLRRNRGADPLITRENQEAELATGQSKAFSIGSAGVVVVIERLPNIDQSPHGWAARVSVPGGGLVLATEEFPFEAPEDGYLPIVDVTDKTPKPPVWQGDNGAAFFVRTPQGYGRITVRNTLGSAWVYVSSYFNPKPGSRNLEFDPAKAITPKP